MSYTVLSMRLDGIIDLIITWCTCVKKAAIRLKSFSYCRALSFDCFIALLLVWGDSLVIKSDILLVFELVSGMSCLGIFGPLSAADWVLAGELLEANRAYTA